MLKRRTRPKMRQDGPRTEYPKHRAFIRRHVCAVPGCVSTTIECAHVRTGLPASTPSWARPGTGRKNHDAFTLPLCATHHRISHDIGDITFAQRYGVNLLREALDLARNSPVPEIRMFLKEYGL